jgi:hypothetical protein
LHLSNLELPCFCLQQHMHSTSWIKDGCHQLYMNLDFLTQTHLKMTDRKRLGSTLCICVALSTCFSNWGKFNSISWLLSLVMEDKYYRYLKRWSINSKSAHVTSFLPLNNKNIFL